MTQPTRKGGARNAPGWRWDRSLLAWHCDRHGSAKCTVCARPTFDKDDTRPWLIDRDGVMMPEPEQADLRPNPTSVLSTYDGSDMRSIELQVDMTARDVADITCDVEAFCAARGDGLVNVLVSHATAGLAIIEPGHGTDRDVIALLERLAPQAAAYNNDCGRKDEGSDDLLPVLLSPALTLPVIDGRPALSSTQSIVLVDRFYGMPRRVRLTFIAA